MAQAKAEYQAATQAYSTTKQSLERAQELAWEKQRASARSPLGQGFTEGKNSPMLVAAEAGFQLQELEKQYQKVQQKYHAFAFPQGSISSDSFPTLAEGAQKLSFDEFNAAAGALKSSPITAIALSLYAIASMIGNGSAGPLTAEQLATSKKIVAVGSGLEAIGMAAAPAIVTSAKKSGPALREAALRPMWLFMGAGGPGGGTGAPARPALPENEWSPENVGRTMLDGSKSGRAKLWEDTYGSGPTKPTSPNQMNQAINRNRLQRALLE
jgi:hypothetical protein